MASIKEEGTRGKRLSYKFRVCLGRDENGRQILKAMRWNPPEDMTPAKAKKEAQRVAAVWEAEQKEAFERQKAQKEGRKTDYTFGQFVDEVWVPLCVRDGSHRPSTVAMYTNILKVMRPHFEELLLNEISGIQITQYLTWLRNDYRTQYGNPLAEKSIMHHYYTYNTMGAGHAGTAYLADATGQLKVVKEVASYASTANPFSVDLVYNSDYFVNRTSTYLPHGSAMDFGSGWTLDCVQTLASQIIGDKEYLRYTDGDGTEHYFTKDSRKDSSYYYDEDGLGLKIKAVTGGYGTYTYEYDSKHNLTSVSDGHVTQNMTYSAQGNVTNTSLKGGSLTMTSSAQYDANGNRLLSVTDNAGATVEYGYSGELSKMLALPESVTDALGHTTTNTYDHFGRIASTSLANGSGVVYTYTKGQLSELSRRTGSTTQNYSFVYNSFGRMTELKVGSRTLAKYEYAIGNGNLAKQTYGNGASVAFTYDNRDRVTTRTTSDGKTRTYRYNEDSRLSSVTDSDGRTIQYLYDGLDRLTKCTVLQDGKEILSTGQSYNLSGQVTKQYWTIDGKTYSQEYTYQTASGSLPEGLLTSMTTGSGETLTFSYDSLGRLTGVNSGKASQTYKYETTTSGNETTRIGEYTSQFGDNVVWSSQFTYNAVGNITEETGTAGTWRYSYDTQGQLTEATNGTVTYTFTYDDAGNILTASDGSQTHTYTYGDASWKDLLTAYDGHALQYDGSGNPTTYYNGRDWTFGWTGGRTLSSASSSSDTGESNIGYTYDLDGIRTGKTVTEKVYHTHAYTETRTVAPTCTADGYTLHICSCGDSQKTDVISKTGHKAVKNTVAPTCTAQGYTQETCTVCGAVRRTDFVAALVHDYKKAGNVYTVCSRCGASYSPGGGGIGGVGGGIGGGGLGPTITPTSKPSVEYDAEEGMNETIPPVVDEEVPDETLPPEEENAVSTQSADRILESETTVSYSYIYASGKLLQEKVTTNGTTETHNFFYDNTGKPYAMQVNGTTYYYVTNLQGDVMGLVDTSGNSVASYTYDPYGKVLIATGTLAEKNPLRYRGYYYDSETGFYYVSSRYYDPEIGRWINADNQIAGVGGEVLGYNMFAYCMNNPMNMSDPTGNWPKWVTKLAAAVAVVAVVAVVAAVTVATAGAGTAIAAVAVGAAKGAAIGFAVGAATGAAGSAISHRISTGSWDGAGEAALNGMATGALSGAVSGAITGGIRGGLTYNSGAASTGKGFDTFRELKNEIGSPGAGNEWHHIVEQCQVAKSGFSPQMIQNTNNIVSISKATHRAISGYYSSVQPFTNGMIVRNWLAGQSFSAQYEFGINVIKMFM